MLSIVAIFKEENLDQRSNRNIEKNILGFGLEEFTLMTRSNILNRFSKSIVINYIINMIKNIMQNCPNKKTTSHEAISLRSKQEKGHLRRHAQNAIRNLS